jgi:hypothetical protein
MQATWTLRDCAPILRLEVFLVVDRLAVGEKMFRPNVPSGLAAKQKSANRV